MTDHRERVLSCLAVVDEMGNAKLYRDLVAQTFGAEVLWGFAGEHDRKHLERNGCRPVL